MYLKYEKSDMFCYNKTTNNLIDLIYSPRTFNSNVTQENTRITSLILNKTLDQLFNFKKENLIMIPKYLS